MSSVPKNHPYWLIRSLVNDTASIQSLRCSYYTYEPQTVQDLREIVYIPRNDFLSLDFIENLLQSPKTSQELAFHSSVELLSGEILHVPMIDMSTSAKAHLYKLNSILGESIFKDIFWFSSGRSFHGYGKKLISHNQWIQFMGTLLLSNQKDMKPTVDPRWIGHRLIAGYSALRWTRNTTTYINVPNELEL